MKIAFCNGGLANQVFQYIFARFVEMESGEDVYLDDSYFHAGMSTHNGFEITKVFRNAKPHLLSQCFSEDVWAYMVERRKEGMGICQQLKDIGGYNFALIAETDDFSYSGNCIRIPSNGYIPQIAYSRGDIYYHGYWINKHWLKDRHWDILQKELQFCPITQGVNKDYMDAICATDSVALHVRRGDFIDHKWDQPIAMYREAVECIKQKKEHPHFFVFSDDLNWCKEEQNGLGLADTDVTFVSGNVKENSYLDMQLMAYCKTIILTTTSSFSYLAALLNCNSEFLVFNRTSREV